MGLELAGGLAVQHRGGMSGWKSQDLVVAVREELADVGCWGSDGIHLVGAVQRGQELLVRFRWRRNPHPYVFPVPLEDLAVSPWTGEPVRSAGKWAADLGGLLEEELLTGYVASASRALVDGRIELREPMWPWQRQFDVMEVGSAMSAEALAHAGFDLALPRRLRAEETLLSWDALSHSNKRSFGWVGNAATCWQDASTARLVHLETAPDLPAGAILDLVRAAVCEAADRGATVVLSDLPVPHGAVLGFRRAGEAAERLDTDLLVQDLDAAAALAQPSGR